MATVRASASGAIGPADGDERLNSAMIDGRLPATSARAKSRRSKSRPAQGWTSTGERSDFARSTAARLDSSS
jgi:hypothetical protein